MKKTKILIVDDEPQILRALRAGLIAQGYEVVSAADGEEALDKASAELPDAIILDLNLPRKTGLEVCRELREWSAAPIIVLSVRDSERDKVTALDLGADDYLTKPFGTGELQARLRVALKHAAGREGAGEPVLHAGKIMIDLARHIVERGGEEVHLTATEYNLLAYLATNAGRVLTHTQIMEHVWGAGYESETQNLRVYISQLRRKLDPDSEQPQMITTEPGIGYRFLADE
ncbi:MAG: response regulator transcription factor [Anaerolineales bacterium]